MAVDVANILEQHLDRTDGQEDLCIALYQQSTGSVRTTAIITEVILPVPGEREVHGNVTFTGEYVLRAAARAAAAGGGIVILHSHPGASTWQSMSSFDADAESSYAFLVNEITGLPLVGMTLATGTATWAARFWTVDGDGDITHRDCDNVRVVGDRLRLSWNPTLVPAPAVNASQVRTVSCWGPRVQSDIARLRILVVGAGTGGLDVALRLAATGVQHLAILDFDTMKIVNLDRMIGPTMVDVLLHRSKLEVADRLIRENATAQPFVVEAIEGSICEPSVLLHALDFDLIFCCVDDHPWPRSILNTLAYTDLIPVIDGGIHIDAFEDGDGMRNATWRSHVLRPGRPCMACNGQLDLGKIIADRDGLFDNDDYIAGLPRSERPRRQNVASLAGSASASMLAQFVSFLATPAGLGEPGPLRYQLSTHSLEHVNATSRANCPVEASVLAGDRRQILTGRHEAARSEIAARRLKASLWKIRVARRTEVALSRSWSWLASKLGADIDR